VNDALPTRPPRRRGPVALLRRALSRFTGQPRLWLLLLLWPMVILVFGLTSDYLCTNGDWVLTAVGSTLYASALLSLALFAFLCVRFYRRLRHVRSLLYDGTYESALEFIRHHAALADGLGLESALVRLLAFDRRRADRVAAGTRLLTRFLREVPLAILVGILEDDLLRFSSELCRLLDFPKDQFTLMTLLIPAANRHFAYMWDQVASGHKSTVEATVALQLPSARVPKEIHLRLLAVQNDLGKVVYVLGFAQPPEPAEESPAPAAEEPAEGD
jgi:hypothetical protein